MISVIITCYNLERYISRAISSCLNQTIADEKYEIIVVDDASEDSSVEHIKSFGSMVKLIELDENLGVAAASNVGINAAKGEYVVRVDGDDFINKNLLHSLKEVLDWNDDISFAYCDHIVVDEGLERHQELNTLEKLLDHGAGVMFRRKNMLDIGLYDTSLRNREDYDLLKKYIDRFGMGYHLRLPYYRYFKRSGSLSSEIVERENLKRLIDEKA